MATAFSSTLTPYRPEPHFRELSLQADTFFAFPERRVTAEDPIYQMQVPVVVPFGADRSAFRAEYEQWLRDSELDSLPDSMRDHDSYRSIVERGDRAIPWIAAALRREPSFIFLALEEITGADPIPSEAQGDLFETVRIWLKWLER